jgi:hypothetical protein
MPDVYVTVANAAPVNVSVSESVPVNVTVDNAVPINVSVENAVPVNVSVANAIPIYVTLTAVDVTGSDAFADRARLEGSFNEAYATAYLESTLTGDDITSVDIWTDSGKATKLFTKTISYSSSKPTTVVLLDEINNKTLTTVIAYTGDDIASVTKTFA